MIGKVVLIGKIPPPIGGVSIHIIRFKDYLEVDCNIDVRVVDIKGLITARKWKLSVFFSDVWFLLRARIFHIHISSSYKFFIAILLKLLGKKIVYTHHNSVVDNSLAMRTLLRACDKIIVVNESVLTNTVFKIHKDKTEVIPAFLPLRSPEPLPHEIIDIIPQYDLVISTNCFTKNYINNKEVYGFDLIIEAFNYLTSESLIKNTLFIFLDPSGTYKKDFMDICHRDKNGNGILYIAKKDVDFTSILMSSDISIRATRTDGDSLSVRESIASGVFTIVSDVTKRPPGSILFSNDSIRSLSDKILEYRPYKNRLIHEQVDYAQKIVDLYRKLQIYD